MRSPRYAEVVCGCAFVALAACSVGPAYKRPDIALPTQWHDASNPAAPSQDASEIWPTSAWWQGFGSAKLDELIAEAQRSNDDLAVAIARVQEADAQARIAGAALLPSLDFSADATRERAQITGFGPRTFNVFSPELTASYELDFWGKNRALRTAARATAIASRFDQETVALTVVSSVASYLFPSAGIARSDCRWRARISRTARRFCTACSCNRRPASPPDWMWRSRKRRWHC